MSADTELTIGQVAGSTGLAVTVIRYYDEIGLIAPTRRIAGQRRFGPDVVARLDFVRLAKTAGLSLEQIRTLLDSSHNDWPNVLDQHLGELHRQREHLDRAIALLEQARRCGCDVIAQCPKAPAC